MLTVRRRDANEVLGPHHVGGRPGQPGQPGQHQPVASHEPALLLVEPGASRCLQQVLASAVEARYSVAALAESIGADPGERAHELTEAAQLVGVLAAIQHVHGVVDASSADELAARLDSVAPVASAPTPADLSSGTWTRF